MCTCNTLQLLYNTLISREPDYNAVLV